MEVLLGFLILLWPLIAVLLAIACGIGLYLWLLKTSVRIVRQAWQEPPAAPASQRSLPPPEPPAARRAPDTDLISSPVPALVVSGLIGLGFLALVLASAFGAH